jgi:hypothetical protein
MINKVRILTFGGAYDPAPQMAEIQEHINNWLANPDVPLLEVTSVSIDRVPNVVHVIIAYTCSE